MSIAVIISLLEQFGPGAVSLISGLITKLESNANVTAAEWATLTVSLQQTAQQRMTAQLTAAGIDLTSAQGVAMLALAK